MELTVEEPELITQIDYEELAALYRNRLRVAMRDDGLVREVETESAGQLLEQAGRLAKSEAEGLWRMAEILSYLKKEHLWQALGEFSTWRELVNSIGIPAATLNRAMKNYDFYVTTVGMNSADPRLLAADASKLNIGVMRQFKLYVMRNIHDTATAREEYLDRIEELYQQAETAGARKGAELRQEAADVFGEMEANLQDFIDLCQPGLMMSRQEVRKWLEEQLGIDSDTSHSAFKKAFEATHKMMKTVGELADDDFLAYLEAVRSDEDLPQFLTKILGEE